MMFVGNDIAGAYKNLLSFIELYGTKTLSYCDGCSAYSICQDWVINHITGKSNCKKYREERNKIIKDIENERYKMKEKYCTKELKTDRLIIKKGKSQDCIKIYEYDMLKCRGVLGEEVLVKSKEKIDFIGNDQEKYYQDCIQQKMFDWYIYLKDLTPIGNVTADRENEENNSIEISYNLHPDYWRKGYMSEAVRRIIDYLFEIGYSNIVAGYDVGNYKSKFFLEKLGFKYLYTIKNSYQKNGVEIDTIIMNVNKNDWEKINEN